MKIDGFDLEIIRESLEMSLENAIAQDDAQSYIDDLKELIQNIKDEYTEYIRTYNWRH